jgi:hypothetical protein
LCFFAWEVELPIFYSHDFPEVKVIKTGTEQLPGAEVTETTLGEVLENLFRRYAIRIIPNESPQYFKYTGGRFGDDVLLVDIHVERDGEELCPRQDLTFPIQVQDIIRAGGLAC